MLVYRVQFEDTQLPMKSSVALARLRWIQGTWQRQATQRSTRQCRRGQGRESSEFLLRAGPIGRGRTANRAYC